MTSSPVGETTRASPFLGFDQSATTSSRAFVDSGAVQCGYCSPGMLLSMYVLLKEGGRVDAAAVRDALSGNLCRCTGYVKPVAAVLAAWEEGA